MRQISSLADFGNVVPAIRDGCGVARLFRRVDRVDYIDALGTYGWSGEVAWIARIVRTGR
jgi:hypothetical protein